MIIFPKAHPFQVWKGYLYIEIKRAGPWVARNPWAYVWAFLV
jgi:hypothetical protein